jgi:branched-chain amino acid transport system substrate-binding protein
MKKEGHAPLGNGAYTYDAIILLALAMNKAQATDGRKATAAIHDVTDPNGQKVSTYQEGLAAIKAGARSIKYIGASGPLDFNQYHNVFGPFAAYVSTDTQGTTAATIEVSSRDGLRRGITITSP